MRPKRGFNRAVAAAILGSASALFLAPPLSAAAATAAVPPGVCRSSSHPALAARLARDIRAAGRGRVSTVSVRVDDPGHGLGCWFQGARRFDT